MERNPLDENADISSRSGQENQKQDLDVKICSICRERNLTDQTSFNNCSKCGICYCIHFASTIDPQYCTDCLHDVVVKEEVITKTETHYNEEKDQLYTRTRKARRTTIGGMHWLFAARKISTLNDLELDLAIEYHRDYLNQMLYERDERRSQKAHRNIGKPLPVSFSSPVGETSTIEVKKTKIKTATKANDPAAMLLQALKTLQGTGLSQEDIIKMAIKGAKK